MSNRNYLVGKGRPPAHSRFRPGQSGNPSGRPKGAKRFESMVSEAFQAKVEVIEKGRKRRISKLQQILNKLADEAAQGNPRAVQLALKMMQECCPPEKEVRYIKKITPDMPIRMACDLWLETIRASGDDFES